MFKPSILIVDDDIRIVELLQQFFNKNNFEAFVANDSRSAEQILAKQEINLIILDIMLPGLTGLDFAKKIKNHSVSMPIILLTALGDLEDRVIGLQTGADDYVTKPFDPRELILRAKNLIELYKTSSINTREDDIEFGQIKYVFSTRSLYIADKLVPLSSTQQKLLEYLLKRRGQPVAREKLSEVMGGLSDRSIDVQIARLRQKIEQAPDHPKYLLTIRHEGYGIFI
ncbi:MAG: response regulator transcription factor [Rickettsiaceae bacterium]|nr:response regulator transcription factor [Rickettsiaceae bacterium]